MDTPGDPAKSPEIETPPANPDAPRAKGKALRRTAEEIGRLARVSGRDKARGKRFWENNSPPLFRGLASAKGEP